ncbi:MAG: hypothetical protein HC805_01805 [Alkalinema sp. RL_2_19]|nr:hypothetical protein [Alkalinema sp. RL_2_19]
MPWQLLSEPDQLKLQAGKSPIQGMISGALTGIVLGIAIAVVIEKLENTFYVVEDITFKTKLPVLGVIPLHPDLKDGSQNLYIVDLKLGGPTGQSLETDTVDLKSRVKALLEVSPAAASAEAFANPDPLQANAHLKSKLQGLLAKQKQSATASPPRAAGTGSVGIRPATTNSKLQTIIAATKAAKSKPSSPPQSPSEPPQSLPSPNQDAPLTAADIDFDPTIQLDQVLTNVESNMPESSAEQSYWLREYDAYGFMEAFRTLGTNLLQLEHLRCQSLVITSALPGEGSSTVVIHLAQAIAAMGKRVLLVDAHMRRGSTQVGVLLGLPEETGLSEYFT